MRALSRPRLRSSTLVVAALLQGVTGCATLRATVGGYATEPSGISRPQQRQREALASSDYPRLLDEREDDELLRALTTGVATYYASQFARSAAVLDTAALIADDRITASLSRDALALLTNDMARPYQPRRTERLFIPYYAMLAWARMDQWEDAAVEARRLSGLLALYGSDREDGERALHAVLHHLAGAVFERAGDRGEAEVAYRAAHTLLASLPESSTAVRPGAGELVIIVERGFVAHRTNAQIAVFVGDEDEERSHHREGWHGGDPVKIAFPVLHRSSRAWGGPVRVRLDDEPDDADAVVAVVDDASAADERRERVAVATRAIARAAAKAAVAKAVKDKQGEAAGDLAKLGAYLLERADVRSWHLLPQELEVVRITAAAGTHTVRLEVGDGALVRRIDLGPVTVADGGATIVPARVFRAASPAPPVLVASHDSGCSGQSCP